MRCYNGCPDSELQALIDRDVKAQKDLAKFGARATYFPMEQKWQVFKDHRMVGKFQDSLPEAARLAIEIFNKRRFTMQFKIEQIAICPTDPAKAKQLLRDLGALEWAEDHVVALGEVFGMDVHSEANLSFNYEIFAGKEFEVLEYTDGDNWLKYGNRQNSVSHLGMHVTPAELLLWRKFFEDRGIKVAQEVVTQSHTNPVISGKRVYNYAIFDTKHILGVDLKFIVRIMIGE